MMYFGCLRFSVKVNVVHNYNDAFCLSSVQRERDVVHNNNDAFWLSSVQHERDVVHNFNDTFWFSH